SARADGPRIAQQANRLGAEDQRKDGQDASCAAAGAARRCHLRRRDPDRRRGWALDAVQRPYGDAGLSILTPRPSPIPGRDRSLKMINSFRMLALAAAASLAVMPAAVAAASGTKEN